MTNSWADKIGARELQLGTATLAARAKIFLANAPTQLQTIKDAVANHNLATACGAAHSLAANAKTLCFLQLHQIALDFETACLANNDAKASALLGDFAPLIEICSIQLRARYKLP